MIVGCIQNRNRERQLTVGKTYTVQKNFGHGYALTDDRGGYSGFPKRCFVVITNEERARLFEQYIQAIEAVKEAGQKKAELHKQLMTWEEQNDRSTAESGD